MARSREIDKLRNTLKHHTDILDHLRTASNSEALAIVRRLKLTPDVSTALSSIRTGITATRPSNLKAARANSPAMYAKVEFELTALHGIVYPTLTPIDIDSIGLESLINLDPNLAPKLSPSATITEKTVIEETTKIVVDDPSLIIVKPPSLNNTEATECLSPAFGPSGPVIYCDDRLKDLRIAFWTTVPINDDFAAKVISCIWNKIIQSADFSMQICS
jgi:hypothetical protein